MNKIKRLFHSSKKPQESFEKKETFSTSIKDKKKRFSMLLRTTTDDEFQVKPNLLSKSTSFLHLEPSNHSMTRSRSMFGVYSSDTGSQPHSMHSKQEEPSLNTEEDMTDKNNDQYLQLGMQYHEKGELEKATHYWRLSAEKESPLGLFFYGIALRHGWVEYSAHTNK
jgi:hypothetical protein